MTQVNRNKGQACRWKPTVAAVAALVGALPAAHAATIGLGNPDWAVRWDNTISYGLGVRAEDLNPLIGNNPVNAESDYKFSKKGNVVTNRIQLSTEFEATYQSRMGLRVSGAGWYDGAYDDQARTNPGALAASPAGPVPYASNYHNSRYSSFTGKYYLKGGELQDAFVFSNFEVDGRAASVKAGRLVQYWGNALFFSGHGISFAQSATDLIKASASPATPAKELTLPRGQLSASIQLSPTLSIAGQYFMEFDGDRMPEGGTYLAPIDFGFQGPDTFGALGLRNARESKPDNSNKNFGLAARWSPEWANGTIGLYGRRLDETRPWVLFGADANGGLYRTAYAEGTKLLGLSYDTNIAGMSTGFEISYRKNTALNSNAALPGAFNATEGARGNVLNGIANALIGLPRSAIYDTGTVLVELAYQRKLGSTSNGDLYKGVDSPACGVPNGKNAGCSTENSVALGIMATPQWLQVFPGVDLSMPVFAMYGLHGNQAAVGGLSVNQGDLQATIGLAANVQQRYNFGLTYIHYNGATSGITNAGAAFGVPNGAPGFPTFYSGGNNMYQFKDRDWVSFTFSTTF